jgi:hypothetical protein
MLLVVYAPCRRFVINWNTGSSKTISKNFHHCPLWHYVFTNRSFYNDMRPSMKWKFRNKSTWVTLHRHELWRVT